MGEEQKSIRIILFDQWVGTAHQVTRSIFLLNGGGAVALLAFIQAIWGKPDVPLTILLVALGVLTGGLVLAALSNVGVISLVAYERSGGIENEGDRALLNFAIWWTVGTVFGSIAMFAAAVFVVIIGLWPSGS